MHGYAGGFMHHREISVFIKNGNFCRKRLQRNFFLFGKRDGNFKRNFGLKRLFAVVRRNAGDAAAFDQPLQMRARKVFAARERRQGFGEKFIQPDACRQNQREFP
jgi:hypothetical protein